MLVALNPILDIPCDKNNRNDQHHTKICVTDVFMLSTINYYYYIFTSYFFCLSLSIVRLSEIAKGV